MEIQQVITLLHFQTLSNKYTRLLRVFYKSGSPLRKGERYEIITIHIIQKYEFHRYAKYVAF